jgi:hypothetical protein
MSRQSGPNRRRVGIAAEPLRLLSPLFVEAPPGKGELLMTALRALFRDHIEERLASGREESVHGRTMPGEAVQ